MANSIVPIAWQAPTSSPASVTFSSIPGTYRDLYVVISCTGPAAAGVTYLNINGDSGTNYNYQFLSSDGSIARASSFYSQNQFQMNAWGNVDSTTPDAVIIHFMDYAQTDKHKSVIWRDGINSSASSSEIQVGRYASTSAITSITFKHGSSSTYNTGSTFALYGVVG
jgi:hypothetical protein